MRSACIIVVAAGLIRAHKPNRALHHVQRALQAGTPCDATRLLHFKVLLMRQDVDGTLSTLQEIAQHASPDTLKVWWCGAL